MLAAGLERQLRRRFWVVVPLLLLAGASAGIAVAFVMRQFSPDRETWTLSLIALEFVMLIGVLGLTAAYIRKQRRSERGLRQATREAVRMQEEAVSASNAKTEFLATMSHEIRTPLGGILGYAELLSVEPLSPTQARYVERIQVAGHSLLTVVDDILDFSKVESGAVVLDPQPFSTRALVDNVISIISAAAEKKGLSVSAEIDPAVPAVVSGDVARIRQVLLNLLNNAVKFTPTGSVNLRLEHRGTASAGETMRFAVEDTGIGIPKDKFGSLFRRFSQVDSSVAREFGGSGLGLAISQQLVQLMGGRVEVESEPGRGSVFCFELVLPCAEFVEDHSKENFQDIRSNAPILVVEDLEENREMARAMLEKAGFQVDCAANGLQAVEAVQSKPYSLVLMDVQMPKMDGLTATRAIRNLPVPASDVPIVGMTANVLSHQIAQVRAAGMNDHLGKPYSLSGLLAKVRQWQANTSDEGDLPPTETKPMPAASRSRQQPEEVAFDTRAVARVRELLGNAWVGECARRLQTGIEETLHHSGSDRPGREDLARGAHKLVSQASQLGFFTLARCCRDLEEASSGGGDVETALSQASSAARAISNELEALAAGGVAAGHRVVDGAVAGSAAVRLDSGHAATPPD